MYTLSEKAEQTYFPEAESHKLVLGLFLLYLVAWYLQFSERHGIFLAIRFEFLLGFFLLGASLLAVRPKLFTRSGLAPYILVYSLAVVVQIPLSFNIAYSYEIFFQKFFKLAVIAWFIFVFIRSPRELKIFTAVLLFSFFKITSEGFLGFLDGSMLWQNQGIMRLHGSTPLWAHPNSLGALSISVVPFVLSLYPAVASRWARIGLVALGATAMVCVVFTGSRTGYLAFIGLLLFYFWDAPAVHRKGRMFIFGGILLLGMVLVVPQDYRERFYTIFTEQDKVGQSISLRKEIMEDAWQVFRAHPLGVGVGAFPLVRGEMFGRLQDTHNLYLEAATNLGIQGLVLFLLLLWQIGRVLRQTRRGFSELLSGWSAADGGEGERQRRDLLFCQALCSGLLLFLVVHILLGFFGHNLYEIQWWLLIGMALVLRRLLLRFEGQRQLSDSTLQQGERE
ncbi:MAG: O-antigen ligase family protein [Desulfuromonadales bacterium]